MIALGEIHTITPQAASIYSYLIELSRKDQRITFVAIGTEQYLAKKIYRPEMKRFFWELRELEIPGLEEEEALDLIKTLQTTYGVAYTQREEQKLLRQAKGNPLEIQQQIIRTARQNEENAEATQINSSAAQTIESGGAIRDQAVNLFPFVLIALISIVALRYLFRGMSLPKLAGLSGFIGLIMLFAIRLFFYKKEPTTWR